MTRKNFKRWMEKNTPEAKKELAARAGTNTALLYQLSSGVRNASADTAGRIEDSLNGEVRRGDLCDACAKCPYYKQGTKK